MNNSILKKAVFVRKLSDALSLIPNVEKLEYKVFESVSTPKCVAEYLVMTYRGGAINPRCVTGNSEAAIVAEAAKQVSGDSDYEFECYFYADNYVNNPDWTEVEISG